MNNEISEEVFGNRNILNMYNVDFYLCLSFHDYNERLFILAMPDFKVIHRLIFATPKS